MASLRSSLVVRITAALVAFTFLATALLLAGIYEFGVRQPVERVRAAVRVELGQLLEVHRRGGEPALRAALERRRTTPSSEKAFDVLLSSDGSLVTGNLPTWPAVSSGGWLTIEADLYRDGDEDDHEAVAKEAILPGGSRLIVGRDVEVYSDREELIGEAAIWGLLAILIFAVPGGLIIGRLSARRLEAVSGTARAVMAGDLSVRVPVKGTGDDFDQLGLTLNAMLDRNEELVASLSRVSDNIAHELRTPLARLRTVLEQLGESDAGSDRNALLRSSIVEAERLQQIFDALLRIARIDTRRHRLKSEAVDLGQLAADAVELYAPQAEGRGQSLEARIVPCSTKGDRDLLFQLLCNLIDNALKFSPEGSRVRVETDCGDERAIFSILDSGPGVPEHQWPRLTERFYRTPEASGVPGFGLGLTLAEAIAAAHGGRLGFDGVPGAFRVTVELPAMKKGGPPSAPPA